MPIHVERDSRGIVTAWLDNPLKRNAMDDGMLDALSNLLEGSAAGDRTRAVVIRGCNGNFCSGRDLGSLSGTSGEDAAARLVPIARLAQAFRKCKVPVVAVSEGKAAGLGVSLACWSDIAIAATDASFSVPEARAGIAPSVTLASLVEAVGRRHALDICLSGRAIDAVTAGSIGLVHRTFAPGQAGPQLALELDALLAGAPGALRLAKALAHEVEILPFDAALDAALATARRALSGRDMSEGLAAPREKRPPAWQSGGHS